MRSILATTVIVIGLATAYVVPSLLPVILSTHVPSIPLSKRSVDFPWGSEKVRGVNIGGWLVLEP